MAESAAGPPNAPDLKLRLVAPGDEPAILKLHEAVYGAPLDPDLLRWKIRYNIHRLADNGFDGYGAGVVVVKDNRIVGFNSYQTRRLGLGGQEILAAESGTTMVLREFRGLHLYTRMMRYASDMLDPCGVLFIYGVSNQYSAGPALKTGAVNVGELWRFRLEPGPIKRLLAGLVRRSGIRLETPGQATLPMSDDNQLASQFEMGRCWPLPAGIELALVRDAAAWRHRYVAHPIVSYSQLRCGETVFVLRELSGASGRRVSICDFSPLIPSSKDFGVLASQLKRHGVSTVDCWTTEGSAVAQMLADQGFASNPASKFIIQMLALSEDSPPLPNPSELLFTAGDFDIV